MQILQRPGRCVILKPLGWHRTQEWKVARYTLKCNSNISACSGLVGGQNAGCAASAVRCLAAEWASTPALGPSAGDASASTTGGVPIWPDATAAVVWRSTGAGVRAALPRLAIRSAVRRAAHDDDAAARLRPAAQRHDALHAGAAWSREATSWQPHDCSAAQDGDQPHMCELSLNALDQACLTSAVYLLLPVTIALFCPWR